MPTHLQAHLHAHSLREPTAFWSAAANAITWYRKPDQIFQKTAEKCTPERGVNWQWFAGSELNTCYNALDRHIESGHGSRPALIYDSAVTGTKKTYTYGDLLDEVEVFAAVLEGAGVGKGTVVLIYMPMVPQAVIGMLACARLGAVHSVVFGGFAAGELAKRITDCQPEVILTASCGIEPARIVAYQPLLQEALTLTSYKPSATILLQRPEYRAELAGMLDWDEEVCKARREGRRAGWKVLKGDDPLYVIYTSGSTGVPKGVVRDNAGHAVALTWSMQNVFGVSPGDVFFAASDIGWVVGHSYIVYGPLLHGCTTILYEGKPVGTPDAGAFWRIVNEWKVNVLFTAPTAVRAIKREDPTGALLKRHDISSLRSLFLAGERSDPETVRHFEKVLGVPIRDNYWQTETGWPLAAACCLPGKPTPTRAGSAGPAIPGYDVRVLDASTKQEVTRNTLGAVVVKLPLPPGCFSSLWKNPAGFWKYLDKFDGYFDLTDAGFIDDDGYISIMSRTDDVINVAGHRLSTGSMEEVLAAHPDVAECAVVGVKDDMKGQVPVGFVVQIANSHSLHESLPKVLQTRIRTSLGPIASLKEIYIVPKLPKTRSGKILRRSLRDIVEGRKVVVPATIEDEGVLDVVQRLVRPRL
ncbi:uncharacterized protein SPPG_05874 [Spizellomyces punctatus DAOM BR117]|uniref:Propionate-CoA ligase n=1 Tax=Spizellomyces punctatus (strain DAOM BR117) TaxID=645134 RepID=A0A0L0HBE6_SPIPD|nr:uncharacterized protein SPPG_05874 [Spizellomyces punctatus DAOM BR117]KNC98910.1 hypothetical protein SPPG_05874 [Spizellomyces punctatus DAOM BR117]|eukprot:XP_016606950.1 hypothetical protein SPPG_05874 [Spizellomyces punctatus DAOM BR117]